MVNNRKAQGLSITTIIVAVIALVVLVVLVAIFTGRLGLFSKGDGVNSCESSCEAIGDKNGKSPNSGECRDRGGRHIQGTFNDIDEDTVCCCTRV